mmetsp:Transcript_122434/g.222656  ORF Transcript_122434/g.222656 Transcript_122434/m.222656 type:complete len:347 (-) Transcript_122434:155-1195(-)
MLHFAGRVHLLYLIGHSLIIFSSATQETCIEAAQDEIEDPEGQNLAVSLMQKKSVSVHARSGLTPKDMRYLDLVRDTLTGSVLRTPEVQPDQGDISTLRQTPFNETNRLNGMGWCQECFTMAGGARVQNVRELVEKTISENIPGDFLEAGAWRGGCSIMARTVQMTMDQGANRRTYVCDSFSGLPLSSNKQDGDYWSKMKFLEVSQEEVEQNFKSFQALDSNVQFRKGYFSDTMPVIRQELKQQGRQLAVLRGDGDMYESYMDILYNLYDSIAAGGYFICDDCPTIPEAQRAIDDFRAHHGISSPFQTIHSHMGLFWQKEKTSSSVDYDWYLKWNATRIFNKKPSP